MNRFLNHERSPAAFPLDQWYVAGFAWELKDQPVARTLLGQPVVLFRTEDGPVAALEDRCCHRELPLSCGTVEAAGLRCGYHGLFSHEGQCLRFRARNGFQPRPA
jgi:vanillate O-demethylase monooxygenase subunit